MDTMLACPQIDGQRSHRLADLLTTGGSGHQRVYRKAVAQSVERRRATAIDGGGIARTDDATPRERLR